MYITSNETLPSTPPRSTCSLRCANTAQAALQRWILPCCQHDRKQKRTLSKTARPRTWVIPNKKCILRKMGALTLMVTATSAAASSPALQGRLSRLWHPAIMKVKWIWQKESRSNNTQVSQVKQVSRVSQVNPCRRGACTTVQVT